MENPTAEHFEALSGAYDRYHLEFFTRSHQLEYPDQYSYLPSELTTLAGQLNDIHHECLKACLCPKSAHTLDWLKASPAFQMAVNALPFKPSLGLSEVFEKLLIKSYQRGFRSTPNTWDSEKQADTYLRYISMLALACHNYLSGKSVRAALTGPETIARMNKLVAELKQLSASDWISRLDQDAFLLHLGRIDKRLNDHSFTKVARPPSRRKDADLPSRLLAGEIIQIHKWLFGDPVKRAVYQLMGLAFIENPLEMRTIERVISAKRKPQINKSSKAVLDTKTSVPAKLLTTEKTTTT